MKPVTTLVALMLAGCGGWPQWATRTQEVKVVIPTPVQVDAGLLSGFRPSEVPTFSAPGEPAAVASVTETQGRILTQYTQELYNWGEECRITLRELAGNR